MWDWRGCGFGGWDMGRGCGRVIGVGEGCAWRCGGSVTLGGGGLSLGVYFFTSLQSFALLVFECLSAGTLSLGVSGVCHWECRGSVTQSVGGLSLVMYFGTTLPPCGAVVFAGFSAGSLSPGAAGVCQCDCVRGWNCGGEEHGSAAACPRARLIWCDALT